jgi:hypothetical protein
MFKLILTDWTTPAIAIRSPIVAVNREPSPRLVRSGHGSERSHSAWGMHRAVPNHGGSLLEVSLDSNWIE